MESVIKHLTNKVSDAFEKCGYELVMTKEKYGGLLRRIYKKSIDSIIGFNC